jgi:1,4-dihydroxy-2-naphthoate octaprenyltransferase
VTGEWSASGETPQFALSCRVFAGCWKPSTRRMRLRLSNVRYDQVAVAKDFDQVRDRRRDAAVVVGTYLVRVGGVPILVVGLLSVASGIAYTGGPYPLGYHGLGDAFVFVFFGLVAVTGTYYVQAAALLAGPFPVGVPPGTVPVAAVVASLPVAAISTNILVVNNLRDREEDASTGKRTLAVRFGYRFARAEYLAMLAVAYLAPLWFVARGDGLAPLLPLVTLPLAAAVARTVLTETSGEALNPALESTGKLLAAYAVAFAVGLAV